MSLPRRPGLFLYLVSADILRAMLLSTCSFWGACFFSGDVGSPGVLCTCRTVYYLFFWYFLLEYIWLFAIFHISDFTNLYAHTPNLD